MSRTVWLEAALNGPWSRRRQPNIPITIADIVADGIACAEGGAAIIHVHAYDPDSGRQNDDADTYAAIIEGIRAETDVIVYPTIPLAGSADAPAAGAADAGQARYAAVETLAVRGLLEWSVVDPGSVNFAHADDVDRDRSGFVYLNPEDHVRTGLSLAGRYGFNPGYAIYEPGFLRLGAALARRYPDAGQAIYRFMFSDGFRFGFPPRSYALDAYLQLLDDEAPGAPWMIAGLSVDVMPLVATAVARGGHVRVGLEDAPLGTEKTNRQLVDGAARAIEKAGGRLADAAAVRGGLADRGQRAP